MLRPLLATALLLAGCVQVDEPSSSTTPSEATKEMIYEPTQCRTNPWQTQTDNTPEGSENEVRRIVDHFRSKGVTISDVRFVEKYEVTCDACHCPRGDWIHANVDESDTTEARGLGWRFPSATTSSPASGPNSTIAA